MGLVAAVAIAVLAGACTNSPSGSSSTQTKTPKQLFTAAYAAQSSGDLTTARNDYSAIVAADPQNKSGYNLYAYYNLGVIDQTQGNLQAAETEYTAAIAIDPKDYNALYNLAVAETSTAPQAAIGEYQQVLKLKPTDVNSTYNLGLLLYESGKIAEGRVWLRKAIALDPAIRAKIPKNVTL